MKSLTQTGKLFAVSSVMLASTMIGGVAAADSATTTAVAQNTATCYAGTPVASTYDTSYGNNGKLTAVWNGNNTFTVTATTPLTKTVTLFVSDYILTSPLYKGGCFSTDASKGTTPQSWYKTETYSLDKNFVGSKTLSVDLPTTCANLQVDLYYGKVDSTQGIVPLNGPVDQNGHAGYGFIAGNIMPTANVPACVPGKGGETPVAPTTPATPTIPQVQSAATVAPAAQLTDTGLNIWVTSLLAAAIMTSAIVVARKKVTGKFDDITI